MAGAPGLEPGNGGIKIRCLTTWLRPIARLIRRCPCSLLAASAGKDARTIAGRDVRFQMPELGRLVIDCLSLVGHSTIHVGGQKVRHGWPGQAWTGPAMTTSYWF